jgi:hypothetical protein
MNISKADGIAQLAKWYNARTQVRAIYRTITGNALMVGQMSELSPSAVKITGNSCEMLLYFRDTSEYEYSDAREPVTEKVNGRPNKYPIVITVKFSNGDLLEVSEFFA